MGKTQLRVNRELRALQRRRNYAVFRVLAPTLLVIFVIITALNLLRGQARWSGNIQAVFLGFVIVQGIWNVLLAASALFFRRFARRNVAWMLFVLGVIMLLRQAFMLHHNPAHPVIIMLVQMVGFAAFYQMRLVPGIAYHATLYVIVAAAALLGAQQVLPFIPSSIGAPVLAILVLFVQNRLTRQNLKIREQTAALARSNAENLRALREVRSLKTEQDRILDTVEEGLFLIDADLRVGGQSSAALKTILERDEPAGTPVMHLFSVGYHEDVLRDLEKFLRLMFRPSIPEATLEQLNPLREVAFQPPASGGQVRPEKYLDFRFVRVLDEKKITGLMATVQDVTARRRLEETVARREEEARVQMELLFSLVHVEPDMLHQFLEEVKAGLVQVNERFRRGGDKREILAETFRRLHSIKGNASVLNLEVFAQRAHEFETAVQAVHAQETVSGGDLLPLTIKLSDFRKLIEDVEELIDRLVKFQSAFEGEKSDVRNLLIRGLVQMVARISGELNKSVRLVETGFDAKKIPIRLVTLVREALTQLARNSLVHGIESPEARRAAGKDEQGVIEIRTETENGHLLIVYRDDGRGLQLDQIKARALKSSTRKPEELDQMTPAQVANLIFEPGLSTAEKEDLNAGRGVGLDLVRTSLNQFQGGVSAVTSPGKFCEFRLTIPLE